MLLEVDGETNTKGWGYYKILSSKSFKIKNKTSKKYNSTMSWLIQYAMECHLTIILNFKTYTNAAYYENFSVKKILKYLFFSGKM